jgi:hypothetical protein
MKFSLIHPSKGRPQQALACYQNWMKKSSGNHEIEHILCLDFDDATHDDYERHDKITVDHHTSLVEATNEGAKLATGDVLIYLSDDFDCPNDWDSLLFPIFNGYDTPIMLKVNDGHQPFINRILTIPIMNMQLYKKLGHFFCSLYKSQWVDCDLFAETEAYMFMAPQLTFPHVALPDDETYKQNRVNFEHGRQVFLKRMVQNNWQYPFKRSKI